MTLVKSNIIWTLYHFYLGTKIYKMYMSTISHNQTSNSEDQFNTISHSKISHVFVWQTLGALKGYMWSECWWVQGLCWSFILSYCTCASKQSENPGHVFSCAKLPWPSQRPRPTWHSTGWSVHSSLHRTHPSDSSNNFSHWYTEIG